MVGWILNGGNGLQYGLEYSYVAKTYRVVKEIRGDTLPSIMIELNGVQVSGILGRDRVYLWHEPVPAGERFESNFEDDVMRDLIKRGFLRCEGKKENGKP